MLYVWSSFIKKTAEQSAEYIKLNQENVVQSLDISGSVWRRILTKVETHLLLPQTDRCHSAKQGEKLNQRKDGGLEEELLNFCLFVKAATTSQSLLSDSGAENN